MPMHDWMKVDSWLFHDFHTGWLVMLSRGMNAGLPESHYALIEQSLRPAKPARQFAQSNDNGLSPSITVLDRVTVKRVGFKQKRITIRHKTNDRLVAIVEIVSPGNKASRK